MKKIGFLLLSAVFSLVLALGVFAVLPSTINTAMAQEVGEEQTTSEGLEYSDVTIDGINGWAVSLGSCESTEIIIPSTYEGKEVISVADRGFEYFYDLESVVLPDTILNIGDYAFNGCCDLTSINIPEKVASIGAYAFQHCSSLTVLTIPSSVTTIADYGIPWCEALTIYCEVESKPSGWGKEWNYNSYTNSRYSPVVWNCKNKQVADDGYIYTVVDGVRYALKNGVATVVNQPSNIKQVNVLDTLTYNESNYSVTSIGDGAFNNKEDLVSITIPNSISRIGHGAFISCYSLNEVVIPASVETIGEYCFEACFALTIYCEAQSLPNGWSESWNPGYWQNSSLIDCPVVWECNNNEVADDGYIYTVDDGLRYGIKDGVATAVRQARNLETVVIPSTITYKDESYDVTSVDDWAFNYCQQLTSVQIGEKVVSIGEYAFRDCILLKSVNTGNGVSIIKQRAFESCSSLTSVQIGKSVATVGEYAFSYCRALENVYYGGEIADWCKIDFANGNAQPMHLAQNLYINGELIEGELVIPDTVTEIEEFAFYYCGAITNIVIPDSVVTIGDRAFYDTAYYKDENNWKDGILYIDNHIIEAKSNEIEGNVEIKDGIVSIAGDAFSSCNKMTNITIPASVKGIGKDAFVGCNALDLVIIDSLAVAEALTTLDSCGSVVHEAEVLLLPIEISEESEIALTLVYKENIKHNGKNYVSYSTSAHIWEEYSEEKQPCATNNPKDGFEGHKCSVCGITNGEIISKHVYDRQVAGYSYLKSEATCTQKAVYYYSCWCGEASQDLTFENGKPLDHEFNQKIESEQCFKSEATCTQKALYYYSCSCGEISDTLTFEVGDTLPHNPASSWSKDENQHWHQCDCGEKIDAQNHVWDDGEVTKEPTVEEEGEMTFTCECGQTKVVQTGKLPTESPETPETPGGGDNNDGSQDEDPENTPSGGNDGNAPVGCGSIGFGASGSNGGGMGGLMIMPVLIAIAILLKKKAVAKR